MKEEEELQTRVETEAAQQQEQEGEQAQEAEEEGEEEQEHQEHQEEQPSIAGVNMSEILECLGERERESETASESQASTENEVREEEVEVEEEPAAKVEGQEGEQTLPNAKVELDAIDAELQAVEEASADAADAAEELKITLAAAAVAANPADAATAVTVNKTTSASAAAVAAQSYALLDGMSEGIDAALQDIDAMFADKIVLEDEKEKEEQQQQQQEPSLAKEAEEQGLEQLELAHTAAVVEEERNVGVEREMETDSATHWRHVRRFTSMLQ